MVGPVLVDRGGQNRRAGPQSKGGWAAGQQGALTEELHLHSPASNLSIGEQTHHLPGPQRFDEHRDRVRTQGHNVDAHAAALLHHPIEQPGRLERLDHGDHRVARNASHPRSRPLPASEVGKGQYRGRAGVDGLLNVVEPLVAESGFHLGVVQIAEPGAVEPVSGVRLERGSHRLGQRFTLHFGAAHPLEAALGDEATLGQQPVRAPADGPGEGCSHRSRQPASQGGTAAVQHHVGREATGSVYWSNRLGSVGHTECRESA